MLAGTQIPGPEHRALVSGPFGPGFWSQSGMRKCFSLEAFNLPSPPSPQAFTHQPELQPLGADLLQPQTGTEPSLARSRVFTPCQTEGAHTALPLQPHPGHFPQGQCSQEPWSGRWSPHPPHNPTAGSSTQCLLQGIGWGRWGPDGPKGMSWGPPCYCSHLLLEAPND